MSEGLRDAIRRRFDPDARLGLRLTVGLAGVAVILLPFLLLWLVVEDHWSPVQHADRSAAVHLNNAVYQHPLVIRVLNDISFVFGPTAFRVLGLVLAIALLARRRLRLALFVVVAIGGSALLDGLAKVLANRHRPVLAHPVATAPGLSFPSGHAVGSLVGVGVLLLVFLPLLGRLGRRVAIGAGVLIVLAVGFSRVALGVHYVSDVVGGWLLGAAWLLVTTAAFVAWRRDTGRRVDLSHGLEPEAAPDLSLHARKATNARRTNG